MEPKMGVREALNRKKYLTAVLAVVVIGAAVAVLLAQFRPEPTHEIPKLMFYTVDDGKTWFADDVAKPSPFEKDGKPAYRCFVYKTSNSPVQWVQYMERQKERKPPPSRPGEPPLPLPPSGEWEVKRPGDADWVVVSEHTADILKTPHCPAGVSGTPQQVLP